MSTHIKNLTLVSVPVSDQQRAKDFYVNKLGFEARADEAMGDQRWVMLAPPGAPTAITLVTWFDSMPPGSLKGLVLETTDIHAAHAELVSKGVPVGEIQQQFWGTFAEFDDPDGNSWIVSQPPS